MSDAASKSLSGFTLVELLVSAALITGLMLILVSMTTQISNLWRGTSAKIEQFGEARCAFEALTRRLSQATLNVYWDYDSATEPTQYVRRSELRFRCLRGALGSHEIFFQAPLGYSDDFPRLGDLLNTWGYYVEYADDAACRPPFVRAPARRRFRLMEYREPSERLAVYARPGAWFPASAEERRADAHVLGENVIALVLLPKLPPREDPSGVQLAPSYFYDSTTEGPNGSDSNYNTRNQLPPIVQVTMVVIDEASARRMTASQVAALQNKLGGLFLDARNFDDDLKHNPANAPGSSLEAALIDSKINYRVFTTNVVLRGAKWSRQ